MSRNQRKRTPHPDGAPKGKSGKTNQSRLAPVMASVNDRALQDQTGAISARARRTIIAATALTIKSAIDHAWAQETIIDIKARMSEIKTWFRELREPFRAAEKHIIEKEREITGPMEEAIAILSQKSISFAREQHRIAEEAREKELAALRARRTMAQSAATKAKIDVKISTTATEARPTEAVEVKGLHERSTWVAVIADEAALREAYRQGKVGDEVFTVNQVKLNEMARETKEEGEFVPGVFAVKETTYSR